MSGGSRDSRLTTVHEQQHDVPHVHPNAEASSPTPAPTSSTSLSSDSPHLLRRLRNHLSGRRTAIRAQSSSSNNIDLNPEAAEFIPCTKMPSKRKASSMGRSAKSSLPTPRKNPGNSQPLDQPIIRSDEVFGRNFSAMYYSDALDGLLDVDNDDDQADALELDGLGFLNDVANGEQLDRDRMSEALLLMRSHLKNTRAPDVICSNSAILYEANGSTAEEAGDSTRLSYLPLCPATASGWRDPVGKDTPLTILPSHRERIDEAVSARVCTQVTWPPKIIPVELFDLIAAHLSRDAVKSMRMVNHEFEEKVSCALFHTSVVPFNTELYDMVDEDTRAVSRASKPANGKGKASADFVDIVEPSLDLTHGSLHWTNAKKDTEGKVYKGHGLRVFQGFGPHIRRFGMSFDVLEGQLSRPPLKRELDHVDSYHGPYDWPPVRYTRFANLAGLEKTADETLRMKAAFSHLKNVHDLALSVDSGLGWLNGPDKSIHARVFQRQSPIFGHSRLVPDYQTQDANEFWATIQACSQSLGASINPKEVSLGRRPLAKHPSELSGLQGTHYANRHLWSSIAASRAAPALSSSTSEDLQYGIMYTTFTGPDRTAQNLYDKSALVPSELRKEQKEWLLETEWAQRAFLECYVLAIMDNPNIFVMVKTLAITKVSSGFLPLLARESFWDALPNLTDVKILVKPDWRSVERDNAGFAETCPQNPSEAVRTFHRYILRDRLCLRAGIKKLNIGWAAGGEHADGIFARNNHIMPAPITQLEHTTAANPNSGLVFKYVEHLTLTNCWMTPPMLEGLVKCHAEKSLKVLTLDSVSLTAHPRFPAGGQGAAPQHIAQALAGIAANQGVVAPPHLVPAVQLNTQNMFNQLDQQAQPPALNWVQGINQQQHQQILQNIAVLQQQAPNLMGNGMNVLNANAFAPGAQNGGTANILTAPGPPAPPATNAHVQWSLNHREGSWPDVLDKISPGPILTDFLPQPPPWEEPHPQHAPTVLRTIELKSCGYAKLSHSTAFDQLAIEAGCNHHLSIWFRSRQAALSPAMMTNADRHLGRIVQFMPQRELDTLHFAWRLTTGWKDRSKAEEAEYDGLLAGGTGRFSGVIEKGMGLAQQ